MFGKIKRYAHDPYYALGYDMIQKHPHLMSDKFYLSVLWKMKMGYELDWKHPTTFNEKLQWLKLYDRNPLYTTLVDKYKVKQWVADKIGEQYVIPTLAVYDSVDEINLDELPDKFVLKCNHDSGSVVICKDKATFDLETAKRKLGDALKKNFYWEAREWPYKNVKRCVFAEKFLEEEHDDIVDYKMMVFKGKVKCSFTCTNRRNGTGLKVTFFDTNWERMPFTRHYPCDFKPIDKPASYDDMVLISERLSEFMSFSRVDFYEIKGMPYFGEITLYPGGGFEEFDPKQWDRTLGEWIEINGNSNVNNKQQGAVIVNDNCVIYIHENRVNTPADYKFYTFNGEPKLFYITSDKGTGLPTREDFFDNEGNHVEIQDKHYLNNPNHIPDLPIHLDDMLRVCRVLAKETLHLRVDFYEIEGTVYCGELTCYENAGYCEFTPEKYNRILGDWIKLPTDK